MNEISQKLLTRLYQDCRIGELASNEVMEKCKDVSFKKIILDQLELYKQIGKECQDFAKAHNFELADNSKFKQFRQKAMINMSLFFNCNDRRIAEMMITGTVMGIIDSIKAIYDLDKSEAEVLAIGKKLKTMQEKYVESLKKYLEG